MTVRGTLVFDIETHSADLLFTLPRTEFVRLIGYRWVGQDPVLTTDVDEICDQIDHARWIIGHNIHMFDLPAIFGPRSNVPVELADAGRVFDTFTHAVLANPAPYTYTNRHGKKAKADSPERAMSWYSLDEQAFQLGVPGKTADLRELALKHGPTEGSKAERIDAGFGMIPVDDPEYRAYLLGDVAASEAVARKLAPNGPSDLDAYALREQRLYSRAAVIRANGFRVFADRARARVDELAQRRGEIMAGLVERYDFPTEGKAPWSTTAGKEAILRALGDAGVNERTRPDWPRTDGGALQLGGDVLVSLTKSTDAEELGQALAELKGQRSLAQLALESMHPDGFAHPHITMLQRSGRWSTTQPGLTVWTARGDGAVEKSYFGPDTDDEVLLEIDYSNADARCVAAMSGDARYAERFEPGADGHEINAVAAWGREKYDSDPKYYRQLAKPGGHGWGYRIGARKLAATWGLPVEEAKTFLDRMNRTYHRVVAWQDRAVAYAAANSFVRNEWGRRMPVEKGHEYTQGPALLGQSGTREIVCDAILRMPLSVLRRVKAQIHDALVFSVPRNEFEAARDYLVRLMWAEWYPRGGQRIEFPVDAGPPGGDWYEASH